MVQDLRPARGVMGVYCIVHTRSGRIYIGSSNAIGERWGSHRSCLRRGVHKNLRLQRAWDKHGEDAFVFDILERVESRDQLVPREKAWLTRTNSWNPEVGYNLTGGANGAGNHRTPEQRAAQSARMKGVPKTAEHRANIWATREVTEEFREQMAANGRMGRGKRKPVEFGPNVGLRQRGIGNHRAKLTDVVVVEIMRRLANGEKGRKLATEYEVAESVISCIKHGRVWQHLTNVKQ